MFSFIWLAAMVSPAEMAASSDAALRAEAKAQICGSGALAPVPSFGQAASRLPRDTPVAQETAKPAVANALWIAHPAPPTESADTPHRSNADDLWRASDGLFYINAVINGETVRLLVDTGASMIVLTPEDAQRVGAMPTPSAYTVDADTAGGGSKMARVTLAQMTVGRTAASAVPAVVASDRLGVSLLGQNWLSRIGSVTIEGDRMTLR